MRLLDQLRVAFDDGRVVVRRHPLYSLLLALAVGLLALGVFFSLYLTGNL